LIRKAATEGERSPARLHRAVSRFNDRGDDSRFEDQLAAAADRLPDTNPPVNALLIKFEVLDTGTR
jgi:hypothetical protein